MSKKPLKTEVVRYEDEVIKEKYMISLEECRKILVQDFLVDDDELRKMRKQVYRLARIALEIYLTGKADNVIECRQKPHAVELSDDLEEFYDKIVEEVKHELADLKDAED